MLSAAFEALKLRRRADSIKSMKIKTMFICVFATLLLCVRVCAADADTNDTNSAAAYNDMSDVYDNMRRGIPDEVEELLPDDIAENIGSLGFDFIFRKIVDMLRDAFTPARGFLSVLLGTVLISSALRVFSRDVSDGRLAESMSLVTCLSLAVYATGVTERLVTRINAFTCAISTFSGAMVPMMSAMLASSGNVTGAAVSSSGLLLFTSALQYLMSYVFVPVFRLSLALAVVASVTSSGGAHRLCGAVKRAFVWLTAGAATIFPAVLSYQTQLAAAADSAAARGLKYTIGSAVPIVGGAIGDALRTAATGLSVIKSGAGALGIAVLLLLTCPLLLSLFLTSFSLNIASAVSSILGCDRESTLLGELHDAVGFAVAIVALSCVVFIIALALFMKTAPAISS